MAPAQQEAATHLLVQHILNKRQPPCRFDCPYLREFLNLLNGGYRLPVPKSLRSYIESEASRLVAKLKDALSRADCLCIGYDFWSSSDTVPYLGVLVFFIQDWTLKIAALSFDRFTGICSRCFESLGPVAIFFLFVLSAAAHTAENIAAHLKQLFADFDVSNKVTSLISDSGSNMVASARLLKIERFPCSAHVLHLVVLDALRVRRPAFHF
jgi:hypothetical protein